MCQGHKKITVIFPFALCGNLVCDKYSSRHVGMSVLLIIIVGSATGNVDMKPICMVCKDYMMLITLNTDT